MRTTESPRRHTRSSTARNFLQHAVAGRIAELLVDEVQSGRCSTRRCTPVRHRRSTSGNHRPRNWRFGNPVNASASLSAMRDEAGRHRHVRCPTRRRSESASFVCSRSTLRCSTARASSYRPRLHSTSTSMACSGRRQSPMSRSSAIVLALVDQRQHRRVERRSASGQSPRQLRRPPARDACRARVRSHGHAAHPSTADS